MELFSFSIKNISFNLQNYAIWPTEAYLVHLLFKNIFK